MNMYPSLTPPHTLNSLGRLNNLRPAGYRYNGVTDDMVPDAGLLAIFNVGSAAVDLEDGEVRTGNGVLVDGVWYVEYRAFTAEEIAESEVQWVAEELEAADKEVLKHDDSHDRTAATRPQWREYRNALRNHIIDGVIQGARPTRPV